MSETIPNDENNQVNVIENKQPDNIDNVKFAEIDVPSCPFVWSYNEFLFPIIETKKITKETFTMTEELNRLTKNLQTDYYFVKQKFFKETDTAYISFHSWYYTKTTHYRDMTRSKLKGVIFTGLFTNLPIKQDRKYGITINCLDKRYLHIHNKRLSPGNTNTFSIDLKNFNEKAIKFVTVCVSETLKKCCVTYHYLEIE